jgi:hypothetical protein
MASRSNYATDFREMPMSRSFADLTHEVLDLEDEQREELVGMLLKSLDQVDEIERAWMEEAMRRYEAIRSGRARTLAHEDVVARLEARFG